jgi:hypothetical protein
MLNILNPFSISLCPICLEWPGNACPFQQCRIAAKEAFENHQIPPAPHWPNAALSKNQYLIKNKYNSFYTLIMKRIYFIFLRLFNI